jgi:hypothetical protein
MIAGEPDNDVRLRHIYGYWAVQLVEDRVATRILFRTKEVAESFAEVQRWRLGLPSWQPIACRSAMFH